MLSKNLKKLTYRLHYRGIKELDIFFEKAVHNLNQMSSADIHTLEQLINEEEDNIYSWVLGYDRPPALYKKIIEKLLT
jgi:succinate dehydrogenase flavin-adding protein (antitoxin of CptAB toxin-antitoxin module)